MLISLTNNHFKKYMYIKTCTPYNIQLLFKSFTFK